MSLFTISPTLLITLLGVVPGAFLMFVALGKYDGKFDDRKVFFSFAVGIVGGAVFGVFHNLLDAASLADPVTAILIFVLTFAFAQMMYLVVIVNRKGLRQKHDAIFAGMSLGVGTGSFMVVYIMYGMVMVIERPLELGGLGSSPGAADYIVLFILSISYSLVFGAAGIFAGLFAYKQDKEHIMLGTAVFSLYSLVIIPFRAVLFGDLAIWVGSLVAGFFLAVAMFLYAYRSIDSYLPVEMEREMRREARRRHRED